MFPGQKTKNGIRKKRKKQRETFSRNQRPHCAFPHLKKKLKIEDEGATGTKRGGCWLRNQYHVCHTGPPPSPRPTARLASGECTLSVPHCLGRRGTPPPALSFHPALLRLHDDQGWAAFQTNYLQCVRGFPSIYLCLSLLFWKVHIYIYMCVDTFFC